MTHYRSVLILTVLIGVPLLAGCAEVTMQQPAKQQAETAPEPSGPVSSLDACLAKIPEDATAGQRLLAEESCKSSHAALIAVTGGEESPAGKAGAGAAGSVSDSLQACLERIPDDATAGQRMLAEQSCLRDEAGR